MMRDNILWFLWTMLAIYAAVWIVFRLLGPEPS